MGPVLETPRLIMRPHVLADFEDSVALWSDPQVARYIGGKPSAREDTWRRLLCYAGLWPLLGYGYWAVREKGSERFVGEVGFADFHRDLEPAFADAPEAGWVLAPSAHGQGLATEAVTAALAWIDTALKPPRTVCMINPENAPSIAVAQRCGYREFARAAYKDQPAILFER